jgi:urea transporter
MRWTKSDTIFVREMISVVLMIIGILAFITPFTPGSWLFLIGLVGLIGKERARSIVRFCVGNRLYLAFRLNKWLE